MKNKKYEFSYNGQNYIFWAWKGDYLNLGAGGEVGIYKSVKKDGKKIWKVDKSLAQNMSLIIFYEKNYKNIKNELPKNCIISYSPEEKQWWITGFNPQYQNVVAKDLRLVCTVAFEDKQMYYAFANTVKRTAAYKKDWVLWDQYQAALLSF